MDRVATQAPVLDLDLFSETSLVAPYDDYRKVRETGPVVRLLRPEVHAIGRFKDVQAALRAADILISGEGVGFSDAFNAPKGISVLQSDGELHRRMRTAVMQPFALNNLKSIRDRLKDLIVRHIASLKGIGEFDAMTRLARFLPVEAVSHLVGLPEKGRERMLEWAAATFNLVGPDQFPEDAAKLTDVRAFMASLSPGAVRDGSWAASLFEAANSGKLTMAEAMAAMSAYIIPSLDTTIFAKGFLLHNMASNPDQWELLREQRELLGPAVIEGVRHSSVLRWFSRVAVKDYDVDGITIPAGERVMVLYGCANRDKRRYENPERFDITRDARDQLAWGTGPHLCAGMHLARLEMEVMLEALLESDAKIWAGKPVMGTNRGLFGFASLPFRID
jgi:cytochrome P450